MSTISTFSGFTMARLGIMASQKALEVTGNNISNINTVGYTRQALDQRALYIGGADMYASQFDVRVGAGALTTGVSQLRDPYLDIRYRNEAANVGFYAGKYSVLQSISAIFDEVGKGEEDNGVIEAALSDLLEKLQNFNTEHAGNESYDTMVRQSAQNLITWFNEYSKELDRVYQSTQKEFTGQMGTVNNLLRKIRELNESIKKAEINSGALSDDQLKEGMVGERGQQALELRDQRNLLIDELAQYLPIDVTYSDEPIGSGMTVEKLTITLKGDSSAVLVDGIYCGQLSVRQVMKQKLDANGKPMVDGNNNPIMEEVDDEYLRMDISILEDARGKHKDRGPGSAANGYPRQLEDQDVKMGSLQAIREMLIKNGEYSTPEEINGIKDPVPGLGDPQAATKRGILYYKKALDALANKIAKVFNEANNIAPDPAKGKDEGVNVFFKYDDAKGEFEKDANGNYVPKDEYKDYIESFGNLFSNSGDGDNADGITAANISISSKWSHGEIKIVQTKNPDDMVEDPDNPGVKRPASTASTNIAHLISAMQQDYEFKPGDTFPDAASAGTTFFTGSFHEMLDYINGILGDETRVTGNILDNYNITAQELDMSRDSVSGVDLNDEAVNMMAFQKSYSAACRLLTTLDEILDKLINGTGRAGL